MCCIHPFVSRSPYFLGFHGWISVRENNMTAECPKKSKKSEITHQRLIWPVIYPYGMGNMHSPSIAIMDVTGSLLYVHII